MTSKLSTKPGPSTASAFVEPIRSVAVMPAQVRRDVWPVTAPSEVKRLIIGCNISLIGEIDSCDKLIVDGRVQANVMNCHEISVGQTGTFKGNVEIDTAEIAGQFQGTLTVHDRLLIRSTGRVDGEIRYGRLEIEGGGKLTGHVASLRPPKELRAAAIVSGDPVVANSESTRPESS